MNESAVETPFAMMTHAFGDVSAPSRRLCSRAYVVELYTLLDRRVFKQTEKSVSLLRNTISERAEEKLTC